MGGHFRPEEDRDGTEEARRRSGRFAIGSFEIPFGRFLTDEVVTTLLDSPSGLQMGGEKRKVTMLMADLRGFTSAIRAHGSEMGRQHS